MIRKFFYYNAQILLLGVLALFAVGCGVPSMTNSPEAASKKAAPAQIVTNNKPKILALGDSLTIGLGLTEKESYPSLLQEKLNADGYDYEVLNAGMSGDTSGGGLERVDWSLNQPNIEIMILELGANDILKGLSIEQMKTNLHEIIRKAKARNIKVLLCGMYAPLNLGGARGQAINKAYQDLATQEKVQFLPFFLEGVGGVPKLNQADGIHPNPEGTRIVADTVYKSLKPMLKK
jgi:acyl-CoA thioesterase-1